VLHSLKHGYSNIRYNYIKSEENLADILTKDVNKNQITNFANKVFDNTLFRGEC